MHIIICVKDLCKEICVFLLRFKTSPDTSLRFFSRTGVKKKKNDFCNKSQYGEEKKCIKMAVSIWFQIITSKPCKDTDSLPVIDPPSQI